MSSKRQCPWSRNGTPAQPPLPSIPFDILLEILKRSDTATFVRAAATAKHVRRAVLKPDFVRDMRRLRADDVRFDPSLLIGVTTFTGNFCSYKYRTTPVVSHPGIRFGKGLLEMLEPVASRGELVVLRQRPLAYDNRPARLRVCRSLTGRSLLLPHANVHAAYPPALLHVDDATRSFRLLVADQNLRTQIFSLEFEFEHGKWGAVEQAVVVRTDASQRSLSTRSSDFASHPVVLGCTVVHWLCSVETIVALDVRTSQATVIDVPSDCFSRMSESQRERASMGILLVASPDGKLGLLVAEEMLICMWTMSSSAVEETGGSGSARWTRQVVIERHAIDWRRPGWPVRFLGFGDRSGAVIVLVPEVGLVEINLGSKKTRVINGELRNFNGCHVQMCLHETDFATAIRNMKHF